MGTTWDTFNVEYAAKHWPLIDPRRRDYCYQPCDFGLHVCGFHPDGNNFLTIANVAARDEASARALFEQAKTDLCAAEGEEGDFVIDLQIDGCCEQDFMMNRQMLDRLLAMDPPLSGGMKTQTTGEGEA